MELNEGRNDPAIFKAVFMAGGAGSGKSYTAKRLGLRSMGLVEINSDVALERALHKGGHTFDLEKLPRAELAALRVKAKATTDKKMQLALAGRLGLLIDSTARDLKKIQDTKRMLEALGYETSLVFVNTSLDVALERNAKRKRKVPEDVARSNWKVAQSNIKKFRNMFGRNFHVVDNSNYKDFEQQHLEVYKFIQRFSKTPPTSAAAKKWLGEEHGAGEWGTDELTWRYKKDTPGENENDMPKTINCGKKKKKTYEAVLWSRNHAWKERSVRECLDVDVPLDEAAAVAPKQINTWKDVNDAIASHTPSRAETQVMHGDMGMAHDNWKSAYKARRTLERQKAHPDSIRQAKVKEKLAQRHYDDRFKHWGTNHPKYYLRQKARKRWDYRKDTEGHYPDFSRRMITLGLLATPHPAVKAIGALDVLHMAGRKVYRGFYRAGKHGFKHKSVLANHDVRPRRMTGVAEAYGEDDIPEMPVDQSQKRLDDLKKKRREEEERKNRKKKPFFSAESNQQRDGVQIRGDRRPSTTTVRTAGGGTKKIVRRSRPRSTSVQQDGPLRAQEEFVAEVLTHSDSVGTWIRHFVHSDNPKFDGIPKKKRIKMAIAAWRSAKQKALRQSHQHIE